MLQCIHLVKDYYAGDEIVHAIRDLSVTFRDSEFVSILGPSGCGKTTLLNIIGGLDQYNSGDLIINGKSTKDYTDADWDTYRNHRVGFVFQSYNLIMHQTVLKNVELSLTLSGVSKEERRQRAMEALKRVGLEDQINKKPTQMSGGQMQRVAIARALVNDPEIVMADEPTGALDSDTSVQIMDLLSEIAKDRLVIMVTHNPELAEKYSTRIIKLKDGQITSDSDPVSAKEEEKAQEKLKKPSMSFFTALSLSFNNLMTKKGRTLLTSFAGSIGIIGIGLIMSMSNGMQSYIDNVQNDTMASYPITLEANSTNISTLMSAMMDIGEASREENEESETDSDADTDTDSDEISTRSIVTSVLDSLSKTETNNLDVFKKYVESDEGEAIRDTAKAIEYEYGVDLTVYNENTINSKLVKLNPNGLLDRLGFGASMELGSTFGVGMATTSSIWNQLPDSEVLREENYQLLDGSWPQSFDEVVLMVDSNNQISDYTLYSMGLMDQDKLVENYQNVLDGKTDEIDPGETITYTKDELLNMEFKVIPNADLYKKVNGLWISQEEDDSNIEELVKDAQSIKVVGIIKPAEKTVSSSTMGGLYYDSSLIEWAVKEAEDSDIVKEQEENPDINVFTGKEFSEGEKFSMDNISEEEMSQFAQMSQQEIIDYIATYNANISATYDSNLVTLGVVDLNVPTAIELYASTFEDKEKLGDLIADYNTVQTDDGNPQNVITYSDTVGTMLSGIQQVINMISYVLMGFVSVSLIVSSIMIGIITYISVLERRKEIGILRAMGASKRDIRNVFNAETFIIGLGAGVIGVLLTIVLNIPISAIVEQQTGVANIAVMPLAGAGILILINLVLTIIAGLIPASIASRKNPVEALRTE